MMERAGSIAPNVTFRAFRVPAGERAALWPLAGMLVVSSAMERIRSTARPLAAPWWSGPGCHRTKCVFFVELEPRALGAT